jgi:hypothetical protein
MPCKGGCGIEFLATRAPGKIVRIRQFALQNVLPAPV